MKSEDLLTALHDEYDIDLTAKGKEDVTTMCNLGEGLYERAMEKGLDIVATVFPDDNKKYLSTALMEEEPVKDHYLSKDVEVLGFKVIR